MRNPSTIVASIVQKWAAEADLLEAQARLTNRVGPRGIQTLVETRRREGLMLPFRVTLRRHSRLALVSYWDEDIERTEEVRYLFWCLTACS